MESVTDRLAKVNGSANPKRKRKRARVLHKRPTNSSLLMPEPDDARDRKLFQVLEAAERKISDLEEENRLLRRFLDRNTFARAKYEFMREFGYTRICYADGTTEDVSNAYGENRGDA